MPANKKSFEMTLKLEIGFGRAKSLFQELITAGV
jgi:hypothetical protein